jgi:hypothetical protein
MGWSWLPLLVDQKSGKFVPNQVIRIHWILLFCSLVPLDGKGMAIFKLVISEGNITVVQDGTFSVDAILLGAGVAASNLIDHICGF